MRMIFWYLATDSNMAFSLLSDGSSIFPSCGIWNVAFWCCPYRLIKHLQMFQIMLFRPELLYSCNVCHNLDLAIYLLLSRLKQLLWLCTQLLLLCNAFFVKRASKLFCAITSVQFPLCNKHEQSSLRKSFFVTRTSHTTNTFRHKHTETKVAYWWL